MDESAGLLSLLETTSEYIQADRRRADIKTLGDTVCIQHHVCYLVSPNSDVLSMVEAHGPMARARDRADSYKQGSQDMHERCSAGAPAAKTLGYMGSGLGRVVQDGR